MRVRTPGASAALTLLALLLAGEFTTLSAQRYPMDRRERLVVYRANQDDPDVDEIYVTRLGKGDNRKVNAELVEGGEVEAWRVGPRGRYVIYIADQEVDERFELYLADLKKQTTRRLSGGLVEGGDVQDFSFRFGPRGRFVYYEADQDVDNRVELYQVRIKTGEIEKLNNELDDGERTWLQFVGPKGRYAYFLAGNTVVSPVNLWRRDLKTGEAEILNQPLMDGGSVGRAVQSLSGPKLDRRRRYVYFRADVDGTSNFELFRRDLKKGGVEEVSGDVQEGGRISTYKLDRRGRFVVFNGDLDTDDKFEVYHVDLKDMQLSKLSDPIAPDDGDAFHFDVGHRGRKVVYVADADVLNEELGFAVDLKTRVVTRLNAPGTELDFSSPFSEESDDIVLDRSERRVVFRIRNDGPDVPIWETFARDLKTGELVPLADQPLGSIGSFDFAVDPRGRAAYLTADAIVSGTANLFRVKLKNPKLKQLDEGEPGRGSVLEFELSERGRWLFYRRNDGEVGNLFAIRPRGGKERQVNGEIVEGGFVF